MDDVLNWLWQGCVVAAVSGVILRVLHRSHAQFRYVLCWVVLVIVLALPILPWLSFGVVDPWPSQEGAASGPIDAMVSVPNTWWASTTIAVSLCAIWSGVHGIRLAFALLALRQARRRCRPFPISEQSGLGHWNIVRARGRHTRLVLSDDVRSAAVLGCGSPVIAIAPALARHLDTDELDLVVIHEWAHVQRRDDLLNVVQLGVRAVAGWHPAVWWLDRQLHIEREAACDETAVALTGCAKGYAASLAKTASLLPARRSLVPAVGALSAPGVRRRILRILAYQRLVSLRLSASAAMTGALSVLGVAVGVAGLRLVGPAAMAAPFEARPATVQASTDQPLAISSSPTRGLSSRVRRTDSPARKSPARHETLAEAPEGYPGSGEVVDASAAAPDATPPSAQEAQPAVQQLTARLGASDVLFPVNAVTLGAAPSRPVPKDARPATPWSAAADAGVSVGRASQKAAVATAGFFTRVGRKIAGSF
ncbi:MAG TPA: M56 family metallopeptidase [Vicinamibacterales bacterium]|nr:M56 family metallopeptidase [Vicinamibacterales bacterium]